MKYFLICITILNLNAYAADSHKRLPNENLKAYQWFNSALYLGELERQQTQAAPDQQEELEVIANLDKVEGVERGFFYTTCADRRNSSFRLLSRCIGVTFDTKDNLDRAKNLLKEIDVNYKSILVIPDFSGSLVAQ